MAGVIATVPKYQFSDATGTPLAGGTLTTYIAGTNTLTNTWQDQALSIANTNPIVLNDRGECTIWLDSALAYKFALKTSAGVTIWTVDNVGGAISSTTLAAVSSTNLSYTGTLTGGTGVVNLGTGQFYKDASGNINFGSATRDLTGAVDARMQIQGVNGTLASLGQYAWSASIDSHPYHTFNKSLGAAVGNRGAVASGQTLGITYWAGDDGTNFIRAASIAAQVDGTPGTNDMPGRLIFSTTVDGGSAPSERMRIDNAGNVGIMNSSSQVRLTVDRLFNSPQPPSYTTGTTAVFIGSSAAASPSYVNIVCGNAAAGALFFGDTDADSRGRVQYDHATDSLALWTANAEKMRITSGGNQIITQPAESAQNTSVTLSVANLQARIITSNAAVTLTLPTGTTLEGYTTSMAVDTAFEVTFIATTANAITIGANGNTTVGNLTVSGNTSGTFRFRKTAANTFTVYRVS